MVVVGGQVAQAAANGIFNNKSKIDAASMNVPDPWNQGLGVFDLSAVR